jgi:hypothetical protein
VRETEVKEREIEIIIMRKKTKNIMPDGELVTVGYVSAVY